MQIGPIITLETRMHMVSVLAHLPFANVPRITSGEYIIESEASTKR